MTWEIRQATEADLPAVLGLYAQTSMDDGQVLTLSQAKSIFTEFSQYPNYRLFVIVNRSKGALTADESILGSYALLIMHNLAHQGTPSAIVEDVVVSEPYQSHGVGRAMMQHAMEQARQAGCYKLVLSSNQKRERAHAFYESLGFERHGFSFKIEM